MLLLLFLILVFLSYYLSTYSSIRKSAVLIAMYVYIVVTIMDMGWMSIIGRPFHVSDPTEYYEKTLNISFLQVLQLESTNTFYFLINWYYNHVYNDPYFISFLIKIDNVLVILIAYLLLTFKLENFGVNDLILLFNPYLLVTISHNVRDAYIILFVSMVLVGIGCLYHTRFKYAYLILGLLFLSITRSILIAVFGILALISLYKRNPKWFYLIVPLVGIVLYSYSDQILNSMVQQTVSAMDFVNEDTSEFAELLDNQYSLSTLILLAKRFVIGSFSLVFTPHPINFYNQWIANADYMGNYGIYTAFDNILIVIGSIYCYLLILPRFIKYFFEYWDNTKNILYFVSLFIVIYVIAYLGITDIRNRHIIFFFILIDYIYQNKNMEILDYTNIRYYLMTLAMFIAISLVTY